MTAPEYTQEFVERGYNNRAAVPEHPRWFEKYAELSTHARATHAPKLDLRYGRNPKETLDLFVPAQGSRGTFVFIHGGYWRAMDKSDHAFVAGPFLAAGLAVAVINYDLCPAVSVATIVDECRRAVAWLSREGPRHGARVDPMVVGGTSAGGHLAAMMMATPAKGFGLTRHPVAGAVSLSGVHDLRPLTLFSFNADLKLDQESASALSPVLHRPATDAPVLIAVGADETSEFIRQSRLLWDAWPGNRPKGATGPLICDDRHHFSVVVDYADPGSALTRATLALFEPA